MIEKLYEKYMLERSSNPVLEDIAFEIFKEKISDKLSDMNSICIDDGVNEQGILYYSLRDKDGIQTCNVPVYGYYASSEKALSKLFCKLSDEVITNGDAQFQINLYAHDYQACSLSRDLLHFVIDYEKQKGAGYLWVGHGTANPNARGFWNKYFKTYQYELVRKIEKY